MFPKNSPFVPDPPEKPELLRDIPIRHVGQADIIEIPIGVLDQWIDTLNAISDAYSGDELVDLINEMRSYYRG